MNKLAPRRVADLVASALPQMAERLHEIRLRTRWASIAGPDVARRTQPGRLEAGCLTITVDNSPWLHELTLRQGELASRLGEHVPEIRSLRFVMGTVASDAPARRAPAPRPPRLTADEAREIEHTVSIIRDEEVASAARRLLTTARRFARSRGAVS